jgi:hypothetical protein
MISFRAELKNSWVGHAHSLRDLAGLLGMPTQVTARQLVDRLHVVETIVLERDIHTDDSVPINGHAKLELRSDGSYVYSGHVRATGFTSYEFSLQAWPFGPAGPNAPVLSALHAGEVFGTDSVGDRQVNWAEARFNTGIIENWLVLRESAGFGIKLRAEITGTLDTLGTVVEYVVKAVAFSAVFGAYGITVLVGTELLGQLADPNILTGVFAAGAVFLILGPYALVPAIIVGFAAASVADIKHRSLTEAEKNFARLVFGNTIRYDDIIVTDLSKTDGNAFAVPYLSTKILMGLGDSGYKEPMSASNSQVFIHELTHAWQMCNMSLIRVVCNMSSTYDYKTGDANWSSRAWSSFNNEQQASIVDQWFDANRADLGSQKALSDPAYHFIRDHVLPGIG